MVRSTAKMAASQGKDSWSREWRLGLPVLLRACTPHCPSNPNLQPNPHPKLKLTLNLTLTLTLLPGLLPRLKRELSARSPSVHQGALCAGEVRSVRGAGRWAGRGPDPRGTQRLRVSGGAGPGRAGGRAEERGEAPGDGGGGALRSRAVRARPAAGPRGGERGVRGGLLNPRAVSSGVPL